MYLYFVRDIDLPLVTPLAVKEGLVLHQLGTVCISVTFVPTLCDGLQVSVPLFIAFLRMRTTRCGRHRPWINKNKNAEEAFHNGGGEARCRPPQPRPLYVRALTQLDLHLTRRLKR